MTTPTQTIVASSDLTVHTDATEPEIGHVWLIKIRDVTASIGIAIAPDGRGPQLVLFPEREDLPAISADLMPLLRAMAIEALRHAQPANDAAPLAEVQS